MAPHRFVTPQGVSKEEERFCAKCPQYFTHPDHREVKAAPQISPGPIAEAMEELVECVRAEGIGEYFDGMDYDDIIVAALTAYKRDILSRVTEIKEDMDMCECGASRTATTPPADAIYSHAVTRMTGKVKSLKGAIMPDGTEHE